MFDLDFSKIAVVSAVALVVIGPERLPSVARTLGTMIGKAKRYVADVKAEVNRTMELEELKKMKETMETAARDVEQSVHTAASDFEKDWAETTAGLSLAHDESLAPLPPTYQNPGKKWRLKRGATPHWYKARQGVRTKALSGAARVARFRPVKRSEHV
ncbi:Sec-independent protein translocase protein TatB [Limnohabitans sp.]|uniref:Sec-independent protein translocase protein TatB n=1 Tax=Limnohabitans sp. TaxID=1907725 RepID=UPI00286F53F7|nr:Sec-independent protein translocase protein TatB [Limnohabitans sp.]